jgi:DNA-binding transcriptional ArsR family regulator
MSIDAIFEALASTPRRKILAYLSETSLTAGEIAERFEMSKPALSKHLKILEHAGLVRSERRGQFIHYSIVQDNLIAAMHNFLAGVCPVGGPLKKESAAIARRRAGEPDI